jgi:hypothetical protein
MKPSRIAAIALASSLGGGLVASAAGAAFNDVPAESQFSEHITNVQEAGIATGYPDGSFRPTSPINRQQAASWVNRVASRSALDFADASGEHAPVTPGDPTRVLATVEMASPAASTGGGWVTLQGYVAAAAANPTGAGCPCAFDVEVRNSEGDVVAVSVMTVPGTESDDERTFAGPVGSAPLSGIVFLPGNTEETYSLEVTLVDTDVASVFVAGTLSATYAPMAEGEPSPLDAGPASDLTESLVPRS